MKKFISSFAEFLFSLFVIKLPASYEIDITDKDIADQLIYKKQIDISEFSYDL